ncbi:MAG TPA: pyrroloquinoline quinone-dependent dehydrogenase [Bryobacteraceae bacterium]|jgi:quinoprotein glucose dehydrogenase
MRTWLLIFAGLFVPVLHGQTDWPGYGHDKGAQRYSPLAQINTSNVSTLAPAWTFSMKTEGQPFRPSQSIPLVVNGVMYLSWPFNHVAALAPETGAVIWEFTAKSGFSGKLGSMRSLEYWPGDKTFAPEILFATEEGELYALDAKTGKPISGFGEEGVVNLKTPEVMNGFPNLHLGVSSAPFVYKNLVITGSHIVDETGAKGPAGDVRAWDVHTGKLVWTFHSVPRPGEAGHENWQGEQWQKQSGVNVWTFFTADIERGILYMPFGSANNDYYGVDREGSNLFANSLVAVDAETGRLKWYFQAIHHDLWDYDLPVPPILFDVIHNGQKIPAVGAMSKMGMLFILDRVTGKQIYGVEERPVPKGDVPGEYYSPTQPFPVKPPPLSRLSFTMDDIAKITPEHEKACRELLESHGGGRNRGPFTPASQEGALVLPTTGGGASWSGGTFDAALGYYIINTTDSAGFRTIRKQDHDAKAPPESPRLYDRETGGSNNATVHGWPCWQPPWGRLTAVDVNTGDIAWQVPFGSVERIPEGIKTGGPNSGGGPISTAGGLIFIGAAKDRFFRAFDAKTGRELWSTKLEEIAQSVPITWQGADGNQYVAVAAGSKLLAFKLPLEEKK